MSKRKIKQMSIPLYQEFKYQDSYGRTVLIEIVRVR